MKSAYELAMERLEKSSPQTPLTEDQRAEIQSLDEKFKAKIAQREVFLTDLIAKAAASGNYQEIPDLETQKAREIAALTAECEAEKEKVRQN
ncbi:MAG: hypothetical protein WD342_08570 [Verrucomicrobiales bacterium]